MSVSPETMITRNEPYFGVDPLLLPKDLGIRMEGLKNGVHRYVDSMVMRGHMHGPSEDTLTRIVTILESGVISSELRGSTELRGYVERERAIQGSATLAHIECSDGRNSAIKRAVGHSRYQAYAGILRTRVRADGRRVPVSTRLTQAIYRQVVEGDVLEIVSPHEATHNSGCGEMAVRDSLGMVPLGGDKLSENIAQIREHTLGALQTIADDARDINGKPRLKRVGVIAVHNTDLGGLRFVSDDGKQVLYDTSEATREVAGDIEAAVKIAKGEMAGKFAELRNFIPFYGDIVTVVEVLDRMPKFDNVGSIYPDLTPSQQKALRFKILRNIAFGYLTGMAWNTESAEGPYTKHEEQFGMVAVRGDLSHHHEQHFVANSPDIGTAITDTHKMVTLLSTVNGVDRVHIVMVATPSQTGGRNGNGASVEALADNANVMRGLLGDPFIGRSSRYGRVVYVPKIVSADTRMPLAINEAAVIDL